MGCDGGTIPKRDELVKTKKKPEKKDKTAERAFRWKHCAITQQPVTPPVVSCELGRIYSKEAVLETLLNKSEGVPDVAAHIRTLKDVKELQLTENPAWDKETSNSAEVGDGYIDSQKAQWVCPISGQEMNGTFKFCFIWSCGCVLSDKALKEMRKANPDSSECLRCQKQFSFDDVIIINPVEEEEQTRQVEKMVARRNLAKKNKKGSKKVETEVSSASTSSTVKSEPGTNKHNVPKVEASSSSASSTPTNGHTPRRSPNGDSNIPAKKSKLSPDKPSSNGAVDKNLAASGSKIAKYSVAKDPNASEAYKSLFTSHQTAQNQQKAHWVTYNPFYN